MGAPEQIEELDSTPKLAFIKRAPTSMKSPWLIIALLLAPAAVVAQSPVQAQGHSVSASWSIDPFEASVRPGRHAKVAYRIVNRSDRTILLNTRISTREIDDNGVESNVECGNDFVITPVQIALPPKARRTIRLQYVGPTPVTEKAFRFLVEEIPVHDAPVPSDYGNTARTRISILLRFNCRLFIQPEGAKAAPVLTAWSVAGDDLELHLQNRGNAQIALARLSLAITTPAGKSVLPLNDASILLAKGTRKVSVHLAPGNGIPTAVALVLQPSR